MPTKLSVLCDRMIEAGWLVALIVTPLFFNVYSHRVFEPDKLAVLRSIALMMELAWVVKGLETWRAGTTHRRRYPNTVFGYWRSEVSLRSWMTTNALPLLGLLLFAAYGVSTVTSIAPRLSLWGSYERLQGLYTMSAYLIVFFSIVALLHTREQVERLVSTVLLVSLPVSLYGIIQHVGTDPIPWREDVTRRVASTMGNPIFVAAFLIMIVPLTLYRLLEAGRSIATNESATLKLVLIIGVLCNLIFHMAAWWFGLVVGSIASLVILAIWTFGAGIIGKPRLSFVRMSGYSMLLSTQFTCILLAKSRGPWIGLLAGLFSFVLLWSAARRAWRWTMGLTGFSIAMVLVLLVVNLPNLPLPFVRNLPYVGRLSNVLESRTGRVRLLIWQGAVQLITAEPLRAVLGYGPETMIEAYPPYYLPQLRQIERRIVLPDRSHNETFDTLSTIGLLGLVLTLGFFTALVYCGLQHLGMVHSLRQHQVFLGLWCLGGIGAVGLTYLIDHTWRFVGISLPLGMLTGLFVYVSGYGLHRLVTGSRQINRPASLLLHLFVSTILASVIAHVVEIQVGIAIAATRTVFWAYAALLVVVGRVYTTTNHQRHRSGQNQPSAPPLSRFEEKPSVTRQWLATMSLLVTVTLITMAYNFLSLPIKHSHLPSVLWLFVSTWLFGGLVILSETWSATDLTLNLPRGLRDSGVYAGITILGTLLFTTVHQGPLRWWSNSVNMPVFYSIAIGLALLIIGGVLRLDKALPARPLITVEWLAGLSLVAITVSLIIITNLKGIRADIYFKQANVKFHRKGKYDTAMALYHQALALEPKQDFYYSFLGKTLVEKGQRATSSHQRNVFFQQAEQTLRQANVINPLRPSHLANLARLYRIWAHYTTEAALHTARLQQALAWYAKATTRSPNDVLLWNEWGKTYSLKGDSAKALQAYQNALSLDARFALTYLNLGDLYRLKGSWQEAAQAYEQAIVYQPNSVHGYSALGVVYAKLGRVTDAIRASHRGLDLAPNNLAIYRNLALLYRDAGQKPQALAYAQQALKLAPPKQHALWKKLIDQLRQQ